MVPGSRVDQSCREARSLPEHQLVLGLQEIRHCPFGLAHPPNLVDQWHQELRSDRGSPEFQGLQSSRLCRVDQLDLDLPGILKLNIMFNDNKTFTDCQIKWSGVTVSVQKLDVIDTTRLLLTHLLVQMVL